MGYGRWGPWYSWLGLPSRPLCKPVSAGCTRWPCGGRLWLVTKSALEACACRDKKRWRCRWLSRNLFDDGVILGVPPARSWDERPCFRLGGVQNLPVALVVSPISHLDGLSELSSEDALKEISESWNVTLPVYVHVVKDIIRVVVLTLTVMQHTRYIKRLKVADAVMSPNGMTWKRKSFQWQMNVVRSRSYSRTGTCQ